MKNNILIGLISLCAVSGVSAQESSVEIGSYFGDNIDASALLEMKYSADTGGYAFLNGIFEEGKIFKDVLHYERRGFLAGIGVNDRIESDFLPVDLYADIGFYTNSVEIKNKPINIENTFHGSGFHYRIGAKFHPILDDLDVIAELTHDSSPAVSGKDTILKTGIGYKIKKVKISAYYTDTDYTQVMIGYVF